MELYGWDFSKGLTMRKFFALIDIHNIKNKEEIMTREKMQIEQIAENKRKEMVDGIKRARGVRK